MTTSSDPQTASGGLSFSVGGIPVVVTPSFWLVGVILASSRMQTPALLVEWIAVVFVSVLVHELGHAWMARQYGQSARIELHAMGGSAFHQGSTPLPPMRRAFVSLAGPAAGIALGGVVWLASKAAPDDIPWVLHSAIQDALWVNWGYGLLNLLPILPLDGGQVLQQVVDAVTGKPQHRAGTAISLLLALGLLGVAIHFKLHWALFLLGWIAIRHAQTVFASFQQWRDRALEVEIDALASVYNNPPELIRRAQQLLDKAVSDRARTRALYLIAWAHVQQERYQEAFDAIRMTPSTFVQDQWLLGVSALQLGHHEIAEEAIRSLWSARPSGEVAQVFVKVLLAQERVDEALALVLDAPAEHCDPTAMHLVDTALHFGGRFREAIHVCEVSLARYGEPLAPYNAACSAMRLNDQEAALRWLERAVDAGWNRRADAEADEDLAPLRGLPAFNALLERMGRNPGG